MSKRTLFLIFALFIIALALSMVALYQPAVPKATQIVTSPKESAAQTVLSFGKPAVTTSLSITTLNYSLPVNISTGKNKVTAVQLELQYDPEILTNVAVAPGSFFTNPDVLLNQIDFKTGRITYAFGVGLIGQGVIGKGTAAILNFSVKAGTGQQTAIIFLPKTLVTAEGISETVLKETSVGQFTVGIDNPTSSASPTAKPVK